LPAEPPGGASKVKVNCKWMACLLSLAPLASQARPLAWMSEALEGVRKCHSRASSA